MTGHRKGFPQSLGTLKARMGKSSLLVNYINCLTTKANKQIHFSKICNFWQFEVCCIIFFSWVLFLLNLQWSVYCLTVCCISISAVCKEWIWFWFNMTLSEMIPPSENKWGPHHTSRKKIHFFLFLLVMLEKYIYVDQSWSLGVTGYVV